MPRIGAYKYLTREAVAKLANLSLVARSAVEGFIAGLHRSPYHGFSVEFAEHREYSPGDDLRYLDWKSLARTDRLHIKQFEEETNLRCNILLDTSASMAYGSGPLTKLEYGCYLVASLAYLLVRQQDSVGLVTFHNRITNRILPHSSPQHMSEILRILETIVPEENTRLADVFHSLAASIPRRGQVVIISDLYDEEKEILRALRHFRHKRHGVILFHLLDRKEIDFDFDELANFVDMETMETIHADPRYVRAEYLKLIREFTEAFRRDCAESRIEYVLTNTSVPFDVHLSRFLEARSRALR
ncbi:MAG: DUF58 domain-containing protein [Planctomycetota bacterium]